MRVFLFMIVSFLMFSFLSFSQEIKIFEEIHIEPEREKILKFKIPEETEKEVDFIFEFKARLEASTYAKGLNSMKIFINEKEVDLKYLVNKNENIIVMPGWTYPTYIRFWSGYFLFKAPDFKEFQESNQFKPAFVNPYLFQWRINDFIKGGENILKIQHTNKHINEKIIVADGKIFIKEMEIKKVVEDNLEYFAPLNIEKLPLKVEVTKGGSIAVSLKEFKTIINSKYSIEGGGWAELKENEYSNFNNIQVKKEKNDFKIYCEANDFSIEKEIKVKDLCVEVREKLKNKKGRILPLMHRHFVELPELQRLYLGGQIIPQKIGVWPNPSNPTTICIEKRGAVGLIALDDIFRVHIYPFGSHGIYGIADNELVIPPESEINIKWAIFLTDKPDYYSIINLMRKFLEVNFKIDGPMVFIHPREPNTKWRTHPRELPNLGTSIDDLKGYLMNKSAKFAISGIGEIGKWQDYKNEIPHGTAFQKVLEIERYKKFFSNLKKACPEIKTGVYFHCFLDASEEAPSKFKDSKILDEKGNHIEYGYGRKRNIPLLLYLPTLDNSFGEEIKKNVDIIIDKIGADGIYWDEFEYSYVKYHYGEPHDGVSADIEWGTNKIKRLKSSVTLLSQPWRMKIVDEIGQKGKFMIFNFPPHTETSLEISKKYKVPRFVENGGHTIPCVDTHLYTPIALGNHTFEQEEEDSYWWILRVLNYGCLYYWYHDGIWADYPTITKYMFPITPLEIGPGYIIGKERILTVKSGYFSFGDMSNGELHFFGKEGREIRKDYKIIIKEGKKYFKIILDNNESCVIIKKEGTK